MQPEGLAVKSDALHGEKVGVGTLIACLEYHQLKDNNFKWKDYHKASSDYIKDMFGEKLSGAIIAENSDDCALGITAKLIDENWDKICNIIDTIPTYSDLIEKYEILGVKSKLGDINVSEEKLDALMEYSPLVRNRLTLMRLRRTIIGR
jgi:glycerol-1-phosphate dehydrogenase [NAD(P)+]